MNKVDLMQHINNLVEDQTTEINPDTTNTSQNYAVEDIAVQASPAIDVDQVWKIVKEMIKMHNSERTMNLWYKDVYLEKIENGVAYISVDNAIQKDWIQDNNRNLICNKIETVIGYKPELMMNIRKSIRRDGASDNYEYHDPSSNNSANDQEKLFGNGNVRLTDSSSTNQDLSGISTTSYQTTSNQGNSSFGQAQGGSYNPGSYGNGNSSTQPVYNTNLNPKYTLSNFIVGSSNQLAHAVAESVFANLGTHYNPLFYYGPSGVGKTHLMQAIGNEVLAKDPTKKILYVSIETFMNEMIEAIRTRKNEEFRQKYRPADVLIIDDIQFVSTYKKTQEELFNTFNALYQNNKQIIIASDRPPKEIDNLPDRLRTRFEGGMVVDIQAPDYETRIAILRQQIQLTSVPIADDIVNFIAQHVEGSVRELEGAINKVITKKKFTNTEPTEDEVARMLQVDVDSRRKRIKPNMVIDAVCNVFDISLRELKGKRRTAYVALARQSAMFLLREELELPLEKIALELNRKDHTTVLHACGKVEDLIANDERYKEKIDRCKALLGPTA